MRHFNRLRRNSPKRFGKQRKIPQYNYFALDFATPPTEQIPPRMRSIAACSTYRFDQFFSVAGHAAADRRGGKVSPDITLAVCSSRVSPFSLWCSFCRLSVFVSSHVPFSQPGCGLAQVGRLKLITVDHASHGQT